MSATVEQIKSRLSVIDVVSSYIKLQKAGINYKGLCPFHNEKSPSFSVSVERGSYHCFGCGKGGDIFSFVQEMEGLDFMGALRVLAERAGVEIVWDGKRENRDEKEQMYAVLSDAADFFHTELVKNKEVLLYLKSRGLDAKTAEDFYLGWAPDAWDGLYKHLSKGRYSGEEIEKAGLILRAKEGRRGLYDRFRSRIMFPIFDSTGRTVGFSGRIFGKEDGSESGAKYVNSPETLLYNKSKILYGLDRAKKVIREQGSVLLVEGQMDIILSHQIGLENTVALSGTALTEDHIVLLKRFADKIVFGFDGDSAGLLATKRASMLALRIGMEPLVAEIPEGKDPADFARESPEKWKESVGQAKHVIIFLLKILKQNAKDVREYRTQTRKEILPLIAVIQSSMDRAHFVETLSKEIGISQEAIQEELGTLSNAHSEHVVHNFVSQKQAGVFDAGQSKKRGKSRSALIEQELFSILLWQREKSMQDIDIDKTFLSYKEIAGAARFSALENSLKNISEETKRALVFSMEKMYSGTKRLSDVSVELLLRLEDALLKEEREDITGKLSMLENTEPSGQDDLHAQHIKISRRLEEIRRTLSGS